jgi:hypothetical protein
VVRFPFYLKSIVYKRRLNSIAELKLAITEAFATVTPSMREKSALDYRRRLQKCISTRGGHVEMDVVTEF